MKTGIKLASLALFTVFTGTTLFGADHIPDAGTIYRELQPQRQLPPQQLQPEPPKDETPFTETRGVRVLVKGFIFKGYESISKESELQALVADATGKELSVGELKALTQQVTAYLKKKGWFLSRAYLPDQDVSTGVIEIRIVQGRSDGSILFKRDQSVRINENALTSIGQNGVQPDTPLNEPLLKRALLLMNELPGVNAIASLSPGTLPGTSNVEIEVTEGPLFSGSLWYDNNGNRYTGSSRGNTMLFINDPFHYGDQLSLALTDAQGLCQGHVRYSFPLASSGLKGNVAYTGIHYKIVEGDMAASNFSGYTDGIDLSLSYPLLRSRTANVTSTIGYYYRSLVDRLADVGYSDKHSNSGNIGMSGDRYDALFGGGYTSWNIAAVMGGLHQSDPGSLADATLNQTEGGFTHFNAGMARLQHVSDGITFNLSWTGQMALQNLDTSEKFALGGPYGVRAYPAGEAFGDQGQIFNADVRYTLPLPASWGAFQLDGLIDAGQITLQKHQTASLNTSTDLNTYWLAGAGMGLNYAFGRKVSIRTIWAHVIGDNPGRSIAGTNADGKDDKSRCWLQAQLFF